MSGYMINENAIMIKRLKKCQMPDVDDKRRSTIDSVELFLNNLGNKTVIPLLLREQSTIIPR